MAANLAGMFAQLNQGIQMNPLVTGAGQGLLDGASQGLGGAMGTALGQDPYSFMNEGAKQRQGKDDLADLDFSKYEDMFKGAEIYNKMGNTKEALAMTQAATAMKDTQAQKMEEGSEEIKRELDNKRLMLKAQKEGNYDLMRALSSGAITAAEYHKQKVMSDLKIAEHMGMNPTDPYEGAFTQKITMAGQEVPVRFNKAGKPIAVLGEGRSDYDMADIYNPDTGTAQPALVNKQNPKDIQFLGVGEPAISTFDVKETDGTFHVFETPAGGGAPRIVAQYPTLTEAEKAAKEQTADMRSINLLSTLDEAINMIDDDDAWVGGAKSWALKYLPNTDARNMESLINSIKSNVGFDELRALKAEGGSLGQVSNIENILLQSGIRNLDTANSPEDLRRSLQTIKEVKARLRIASSSDNPDGLFIAERDEQGQVTGNKLYKVNNDSIAVIGPNGEYLRLETR